jgi:hypothetical protein
MSLEQASLAICILITQEGKSNVETQGKISGSCNVASSGGY